MKNIITILGVLILYGCSQDENQHIFFNVDELNEDLRKKVGINISELKEKSDSVYKLDNQFYINLIEEMSGGLNSNSFLRSKLPEKPVDLKGGEILNVSEYDSLATSMMLCFADNMIMTNCDNHSQDSLCIVKQKWYGLMSGEEEAHFSYSFFFPALRQLYDKQFVSKEEFHYLILYLHYLGVLNGTERE